MVSSLAVKIKCLHFYLPSTFVMSYDLRETVALMLNFTYCIKAGYLCDSLVDWFSACLVFINIYSFSITSRKLVRCSPDLITQDDY